MRDERSNSSRLAQDQARTHKRCPACGKEKVLSEFYRSATGRPSGYCKGCQRAISRRARKRRNAAIRALIALQPDAWRAALARTANDDPDHVDHGGQQGGGSDAA
jgi:hypothetical protein